MFVPMVSLNNSGGIRAASSSILHFLHEKLNKTVKTMIQLMTHKHCPPVPLVPECEGSRKNNANEVTCSNISQDTCSIKGTRDLKEIFYNIRFFDTEISRSLGPLKIDFYVTGTTYHDDA